MIITAMDNWSPRPGTLFEWHPVARTSADEVPDPTPASFLQENHIRGVDAVRARGGTHHAYLGAATEIDGELDVDALTRALETFVLRHEGFRTRLDVLDGEVRRHRVLDHAVRFRPVATGRTLGHSAFREYARTRFSNEAVASAWPGFAVGAIRREHDFTLYYGVDHALSDGVSQILVVSELADLYRAECTGTPAVDTTAWSGSFLDYVHIENDAGNALTADSAEIRRWAELVTANDGAMPSFPLDLGLDPGETAPVRPIEMDLLDAAETERFERVARAAGGSFTSGLLAAVATTDLELAGRRDYFGLTVLSTRHLGDFALSQGWFCNFAPVAFRVAGARDFSSLVQRAHRGYDEAKALAAAPIGAVLRLLFESGVGGPDLARSPHMLSYIDFRRFPGHGTPADDAAILFTGEGRTANASMWFNRDRDHFYLGSQTPDTPVARRQTARYHAHLRAVLRDVARTGDHRPVETEREVVRAGHQH